MKFAIFSIQQFLADYNRLPFNKRLKRTHLFVTKELPHILSIIIEEEKKHADLPYD